MQAPAMQPPPIEPRPDLTDKRLQDKIVSSTAMYLYDEIPECDCGKDAGVEVTLKQNANYRRTFFRCHSPPGPKQCRYFQWTAEQPLLEERFRSLRQRVLTSGESYSPRELLCHMLQVVCPHSHKSHAGTNAYASRSRCWACHKLLEVKKRESASTTKKKTTASSPTSSNLSLNADYQEFLEWQRQRY